MVAQIPLPWQLTDLLSAMGLGFLYAGVYALLCRLFRRRACQLLPGDAACVYSTPQQRQRQRRRRRKRRKAAAFTGQILYAAACCFFTRAWVLTESRAAQFRWSMAVGIVLGWAVFYKTVRPVLHRMEQRLLQLTAPGRRLARRWKTARHTRTLAAREKRRLRYAQREERLRHNSEARKKKAESQRTSQNEKEFEKNEQKRLQTTAKVYYNNL